MAHARGEGVSIAKNITSIARKLAWHVTATYFPVDKIGGPYDILLAAMSSEANIKELCARAIAAEGAEVEPLLRELHAALKAHIESLREMAVALLSPLQPPPDSPQA